MKKLLVATSALVAAAGSAAALDLTLNGDISISADIDLAQSGFNGADWDAGFTLAAEGESMGWVYGGTLEFGMGNVVTALSGIVLTAQSAVLVAAAGVQNEMGLFIDSASVYMEADFMGRIAIQDSCGDFVDAVYDAAELDAADEVGSVAGDHCVEWTGMSFGGLEVMAAMSLDPSIDSLIIGAAYTDASFGKLSAEYDVQSENWDAEFGTILGGTTLGAALDYNATEDDYDYTLAASGDFGDFSYAVAYSPTALLSFDGDKGVAGLPDGYKQLNMEVGYDCLTASVALDPSGAADGAYEAFIGGTEPEMGGLLGWEIEADCTIHDGIDLTASLSDTANRAEALGGDVPGGMAGSVGLTVSF